MTDPATSFSKLKALEPVFSAVQPYGGWAKIEGVQAAFEAVEQSFEADLEYLSRDAGFVFSIEASSEELSRQTATLLHDWQVSGRAPSLAALSVFALEKLGIQLNEDILQGVLVSGVLGEVKNELSYHNNMHFRKVLLQTIRMIAVHNSIYEGTARAFDDRQVGLMLIAASIHDLGHDGQGNTVKGVFTQSRMERRSFEYARPYLEASGIVENDVLRDLFVLLLCTDVTPLGDPGNPANQMKAAYRFHFMGDKNKLDTLNLDDDLDVLQKNEKLCMMGLILHEADIATSAGVTYVVTKYETSIYRREVCDDEATPEHVVQFLDKICQRKMLSDAGQKLFGANLARIYALAEEDIKKGNHPFPRPEHSEFIVGYAGGSSAGKILN